MDKLPSGIDLGQLGENLKLTPTERLEKLRLLVEFLDEVRRAGQADFRRLLEDAPALIPVGQRGRPRMQRLRWP